MESYLVLNFDVEFFAVSNFVIRRKDWALVAAKTENEVYRSLDPKADAATATLSLPQSFIRARYGSGELLPTPLQFEHPARTQSPWTTWTEEVLRDTAFSNLLRKARVIPSIILSRHAYYTKDNMAVEHLVRRWNRDTHTFIFAFGEVGVTLEDVINLTLLPIHGDNDLDTLRVLSLEEKNWHDILISIIAPTDTQMGPFLKEWCRHFVNGNGRNSPVRREAFVLAWLTIIFGAYTEMAPIAVKIAAGVSFPLAPLYLGNLYHCFDLLVDDEIAIYSCLDVYFPQMFLLEHYPRYAGDRAVSGAVLNKNAYGDDWSAYAGFSTCTYPAVCG
ncbi:hypothetical protein COLO4_35428 [Corchorus olitorius]|uniref:Aminotransferase-like plant mobile domain-containing protein n=1 Tax=Corchorus olitorius TaxID=93759 RepID=A0A1R3GH56_9ROSI|nr:hypothetical protein COLO4_35428 [Corchorus olitorius]